MLVWRSSDFTRYGIQLKDHIMKSEKKIIWHTRQLVVVPGKKGRPYLDADSQRIESISYICSSPELRPVNGAALQHVKLLPTQRKQSQLSERRACTENIRRTTNDW
jgi:hypothetical protein